ncbi:MAG: hypothetical protein WD555_06360 [Fulvivirga sp.]
MAKKPHHILHANEYDRLLFTEAFAEMEINTLVRTVNMQLNSWNGFKKKFPLPDLLFLDLKMPFKNGLECLKEIRSNEKLKEISIGIFSTSRNEKD